MSNLHNEFEQTSSGIEPIARSVYFSHIAAGNYFPDRASLFAEGSMMRVDLFANRYILISTNVEKWGDILTPSDGNVDAGSIRHIFFIINNVTTDIYAKLGKVLGCEFFGKHYSVIGLNDEITDPVTAIKSASLEATEFLENNFNLSITSVISRIYDDIMAMPKALDDTASVQNYISMYDEDVQVAAYDDFSFEALEQNESDYLEMQTKLLSCIKATDFDSARKVVHDMAAKELFLIRPSVQLIRHRFFGLVNTLLHMTETLRQTIGDELYYELDPGSVLCEADSITTILEYMDEMFDRLLEFSEEKKKDTPPPWVALVREYVDANFRDFNLTVSYVSDRFNISPSYCSRIFKQYSGLGLFEYIQRCRLEAAKALMNTNMSVKSIAEEVGFSSSLTMNRAFKRYEGTTPSKFKEI